MKLLVLGGTQFVGRAVVEAAAQAGWDVTTFNRGQSGHDVVGVTTMRGDRTSPQDIDRLAKCNAWDVVVDTSGFVPRNVLHCAKTLARSTWHFMYVSTVSVYASWPNEPLNEDSPVLPCPADAGADYGEDVENGPTRYGYQKSGCERAVQETYGPARSTVVRPGVVLGPNEYVGRLPWWLNRVSRGGSVVAPAPADRPIQPIDVRDVAEFIVGSAADFLPGTFNLSAPNGHTTFQKLLESCAEAVQTAPQFHWYAPEMLAKMEVRQWSELPLWRTGTGTWQVDSAYAQRAGLRCRPISETVHDTWSWMKSGNAVTENLRSSEIGLAPEKEERIVNAHNESSNFGS